MAEEDRHSEDNGRDDKGRFARGNSGGGRPAVAKAFRERCREFMSEEGWCIIAAMARHKSRDQRPALELIAAYAYGKPTQPLAGDDELPALRILIGDREVGA